MVCPCNARPASLAVSLSTPNDSIDQSIDEVQAAGCEEESVRLQVAMSAGPDMFVFILREDRM